MWRKIIQMKGITYLEKQQSEKQTSLVKAQFPELSSNDSYWCSSVKKYFNIKRKSFPENVQASSALFVLLHGKAMWHIHY